jgi:hypothetical protein
MTSSALRNPVLSAFLGGGLLVGCAAEGPSPPLAAAQLETQCGPTWDAQQVEQYDGTLGMTQGFVARHERRVGYQVGTGCSGTLISDDLFLSAGQCGYQVGDTIRFDYQIDRASNPRAARDFSVIAVLEQEYSSDWDYAIVRLAGQPGNEYGHASVAPIDPVIGEPLTIIGHPVHQAKQVHVGPLLDYAANTGPNWFRHHVDTRGGNSGSGVLDRHGRLIGVHTNGTPFGCGIPGSTDGNAAMRMSQLVTRSPTLAALSRSKLVWTHVGGGVSIWTVDPYGDFYSYAEHGPFDGWTPISLQDNRLMWRHTNGAVSLWIIDDAGNHVSYKEHGPFDGWTAVSYANRRLLWRHTSGLISLWTVDDAGNYVSHAEHGPFDGWTAVGYANSRILWTHTTGQASFWVVDENGGHLGYRAHGPFDGFTPLSYSNGELLWKHTSGKVSFWSLDREGNRLTGYESPAMAGWEPIAGGDRRFIYRDGAGSVRYANTDSDGVILSFVDHGPHAGWTPQITAAGRP